MTGNARLMKSYQEQAVRDPRSQHAFLFLPKAESAGPHSLALPGTSKDQHEHQHQPKHIVAVPGPAVATKAAGSAGHRRPKGPVVRLPRDPLHWPGSRPHPKKRRSALQQVMTDSERLPSRSEDSQAAPSITGSAPDTMMADAQGGNSERPATDLTPMMHSSDHINGVSEKPGKATTSPCQPVQSPIELAVTDAPHPPPGTVEPAISNRDSRQHQHSPLPELASGRSGEPTPQQFVSDMSFPGQKLQAGQLVDAAPASSVGFDEHTKPDQDASIIAELDSSMQVASTPLASADLNARVQHQHRMLCAESPSDGVDFDSAGAIHALDQPCVIPSELLTSDASELVASPPQHCTEGDAGGTMPSASLVAWLVLLRLSGNFICWDYC